MLLNTREREREAIANRAVQAVPRPAPAVAPPPPALYGPGGLFVRGRGLFEPPAPEPPRPPPRPAAQLIDLNIGGDFDWIDDPSAYAQFSMTFMTLI